MWMEYSAITNDAYIKRTEKILLKGLLNNTRLPHRKAGKES